MCCANQKYICGPLVCNCYFDVPSRIFQVPEFPHSMAAPILPLGLLVKYYAFPNHLRSHSYTNTTFLK